MKKKREYNGFYEEEFLNRVAFPLGGIGSGMICLEGTGALSHFSIRNKPDIFNEPLVFSALCIKGKDENIARVLEGQVPDWKKFGNPGSGNGAADKTYGLPRFLEAKFIARFPFGIISIEDPKIPLDVQITGWSPFTPGDSYNSSLPCAALEYKFKNTFSQKINAIYSFNTKNFMAESENNAVLPMGNGFILWEGGTNEKPWQQGAFCVSVDDEEVIINHAWFRGGWFDPLSVAWKNIKEGNCVNNPPIEEGDPSPGASLYIPLNLEPGEEKTVKLKLSWYVPVSNIRIGDDPGEDDQSCSFCGENREQKETYQPWYSTQFKDINEVAEYWSDNYLKLREKSNQFSNSFYQMTLPDEVVEAVAANLTILKSPTVLRQFDGRLWGYEGCCDSRGCCHGSCTHVWNYAQALPHLFPGLERSLRQTEFNENQNEEGRQKFRANLPIRPTTHDFHAASDGQLGGIMKVYREWRISGDTEWIRLLWPRVKQSLNYCINSWDPDHLGVLVEPHHNTYDIQFWGPDGMCTSFYLGALQAAIEMGKELNEDISLYKKLLKSGIDYMEKELYNGEYFYQKVQWSEERLLKEVQYPEERELLKEEGPKYQYGKGCLSDGVLGSWMAAVCGLSAFLDKGKVISHLKAVYKYNFRKDLKEHANPQRPSYALGSEGGLLLCSWPEGNEPTLPFVYSNEVWTGIEYQVASHLMMNGMIEEGLDIVRTCRDRYSGKVRNPFNEYECGHWYARAMSSYGLLQGLTGIRYDTVNQVLHINPSIEGDFTSFLATETGYGNVGLKDGKPFVDVIEGTIDISQIDYQKK